MSGIIIDSSVALSWCFADEASAEMDAVYERVRDGGALVPNLWHLEVGNSLLQAEKRGRITTGSVPGRLQLLGELPIAVDEETTGRAWRDILILARAERLTTYDAAYLELAMRYGAPLATKDRALHQAARAVGVTALPEVV